MGQRALTASSGLAPWSMAVDRTSAVWRKIQPLMGSRGLAPSCCLPHWGREGVTLTISTPTQKTRGDFYRTDFFGNLKAGLRILQFFHYSG